MRRFLLPLVALAFPTLAMAQYSPDPMTQPVTPRDVPWYMAHPDVTRATLRVCASNSAYAMTHDCQNAKQADYGLLAREHERTSRGGRSLFLDPAWWDTNPVMRRTTLIQCRRRGPGDELAYPYCKVAAASEMRVAGSR